MILHALLCQFLTLDSALEYLVELEGKGKKLTLHVSTVVAW